MYNVLNIQENTNTSELRLLGRYWMCGEEGKVIQVTVVFA